MERTAKNREFFDYTRKTRYTKELKDLDKRFSFVWNKKINQWALFQNNKLIGNFNFEREAINYIKYIFGFHRRNNNGNKKAIEIQKEEIEYQERKRNEYIEDIATEAGERGVVAVHGVTPMIKLEG